MHNRKKTEKPPSEAEIAALQKKSQTYESLVSILFERRRNNDHSKDTLDLLGKMLRNNPDFYSLWNFRREVLFSLNPALLGASERTKYDAENANELCLQEMELSADGIRRNPKSCKFYNMCWLTFFEVSR
jgi:geranylgeranyl transferase type-2 subunit alpha